MGRVNIMNRDHSLRRVAIGFVIGFAAIGVSGCTTAPDIPTESPAPLTFDVGSRPDFATDMIRCLTELGWSVKPGTDGGISADVPNEQADVYESDQASCAEQFGYDTPPPTLTESQIREVYPHMLWEWKCLSENDYGPEPPPTEQSYLDDYHEYGSLWTPYSQFTSTMSPDELDELFATCPRAF